MIPPPSRSTLFPYTTLFRSPESSIPSFELGSGTSYFWFSPVSGGTKQQPCAGSGPPQIGRAHVELQSPDHLVCRLLLEKKKSSNIQHSLPHAQTSLNSRRST